jgi:hypothetical protein
MKKKIKHARRKVTKEQVETMNRQLKLTHANYRYARDQNGRLTETPAHNDLCGGCWC